MNHTLYYVVNKWYETGGALGIFLHIKCSIVIKTLYVNIFQILSKLSHIVMAHLKEHDKINGGYTKI